MMTSDPAFRCSWQLGAFWPLKLASCLLALTLQFTSPATAQTSQFLEIQGSYNTVVQIIIELSQGDPNWLRNNEERITKLAQRLGVSNALIANFLGKVVRNEVQHERWPEILARVAEDYRIFEEKATLLAANDPVAHDLVLRAKEAAERANFDGADRLLIEADRREAAAEAEVDTARRKRRVNRAEFGATRAQNRLLELRYAEAGGLFEEAADLVRDIDQAKRKDLLNSAAGLLLKGGPRERRRGRAS